AYGRHGLTLLADTGSTAFAGSITAERTAPEGAPPYIIGSPDGTRIEVAGARLAAETSLSEARQTLSLSANVVAASLIVAPGDGTVDAEVTAGLAARIGPVEVTVDGVGVRSSIRFTEGRNLGVADLAVGFRGPGELGLVVDAGPVTGAGVLAFDAEREQYAG